jgi:hypothetical protein
LPSDLPPSASRALRRVVVERDVAGARLRARCSPHHRVRAGSALQAFGGLEHEVGKLRVGTSIRFGWSLLRLFGTGEDVLEAREPNFAAWPADAWSPTIDRTLDVVAAQVTILRRVGAEPLDATFDQYLVTIPGVLEQPTVFVRRDPRQGADDSGWTLAPLSDPDALTTASDVRPVTLAVAAVRRPAVAAVLTLPLDYIAVIDGEYVMRVYDDTGHERLPGPEHITFGCDSG